MRDPGLRKRTAQIDFLARALYRLRCACTTGAHLHLSPHRRSSIIDIVIGGWASDKLHEVYVRTAITYAYTRARRGEGGWQLPESAQVRERERFSFI